MLFNSYIFLLVLLPLSASVQHVLPGRRSRWVALVASGLLFYAAASPTSVPILLLQTGFTFVWARLITQQPSRRRLLLGIGITVQLILLATFRYLPTLSPGNALAVLAPIGLSFATFQAIAYLTDVSRGTISAERALLPFLAFFSFFPTLRSGPILRYQPFRAQLDTIDQPRDRRLLAHGAVLLILGLAKKVLIADQLGETVDALWANPAALSTVGVWAATLGYALQLYFDFSGYSDMAVGSAALLGLRIPHNFNAPYAAKNPSDFWRRWHITLGDFVRDYLYIPLGGSRAGGLRTALHLLVAMTLVGLWHGPAITFVVWGAYHGLLLAAYHAGRSYFDRLPSLLQRGITGLFILIGWVIFRAPSWQTATFMLTRMFGISTDTQTELAPTFLALLGAAALLAVLGKSTANMHPALRPRLAVVLGLLLTTCLLYMNYRQATFLYYQF